MSVHEDREDLLNFIGSLSSVRAGDRIEMDSLALLQVVVYLEERFGIRLPKMGLEPDDLRSLDRLMALVERRG